VCAMSEPEIIRQGYVVKMKRWRSTWNEVVEDHNN